MSPRGGPVQQHAGPEAIGREGRPAGHEGELPHRYTTIPAPAQAAWPFDTFVHYTDCSNRPTLIKLHEESFRRSYFVHPLHL